MTLRGQTRRSGVSGARELDVLSAVLRVLCRYISLMLDHVESPELPADRVLAAVLAVRDAIRLSEGRYPNMTVSDDGNFNTTAI